MCGYCHERVAIEIARKVSSCSEYVDKMQPRAYFESLYFQECENVLDLLPKIEVHLIDKFANNSDKIWDKQLTRKSIYYRIVEVLVNYGFNSAEYQELIKSSLVRDIITKESGFALPPIIKPESGSALLQHLFSKSMFYKLDIWETIIKTTNLLDESKKILKIYLEFRNQNNIGEGFYELFPYAFFSFLMISINKPNNVLIQKIAKEKSIFGALPGSPDLWLQRKAVLILFKELRLKSLLPFKTLRTALVYYSIIKNKLSPSEKEQLHEALLSSGVKKSNNRMSNVIMCGDLNSYYEDRLIAYCENKR